MARAVILGRGTAGVSTGVNVDGADRPYLDVPFQIMDAKVDTGTSLNVLLALGEQRRVSGSAGDLDLRAVDPARVWYDADRFRDDAYARPRFDRGRRPHDPECAGTDLHPRGRAAVSVASGKEAVAYCTQQLPSIVLLDYMMPDMDGLEALRRIRAINDASALLPVVIFTAAGDDWLREKAMSLGATEVWLKASLTGEEIKRRLHELLA